MKIIDKETLKEILQERHSSNEYTKLSSLPSPFLFKDIKKASKRVLDAIKNDQKITIVGDYDVDGVISTLIMVEFFQYANIDINYIIPNRFEHGYGISPKLMEEIDSDVVITVDNGISAYEAARLCKEKNIDLIITDHHTVGEQLPDAYAIINPKQEDCGFPFKDICGAQVAWYFCAALKKELDLDIDLKEFLDVLSIAIVADVMPMNSLNHTLVKSGMQRLPHTKRVALQELLQTMDKNIFSSDDIGFMIAPKLNSAGRMDSAMIALEFLLSKNSFDAVEGLTYLNQLNEDRKVYQQRIIEKAKLEADPNDDIIVVWGDDWHEGIIGIVASSLSSHFKRPAFVFSISNGIAKGSARSSGEIHLYKLLDKVDKDLLLGFGGHKSAAGLSVKAENLDGFKQSVNSVVKEIEVTLHEDIKPLGELALDHVDFEFLDIIDAFEPYGLENDKPIFQISNATVLNKTLFGKERNHLKLLLQKEYKTIEVIGFHTTAEELEKQDKLNLIVSLNKNRFRGETNIQYLLKAIV